jgi:DNA-binding response OmpR family regulator
MSCILVIEDDQTIREALMTGLTERDHVVVGAPNGIAGLEAILTTTPDLVLLDTSGCPMSTASP